MELLRLLLAHPQASVELASSDSEQGVAVAEVLPALRGHTELRFVAHDDAGFTRCDTVFIAAPDGVAMYHAPRLLDAGVRVIDLSSDFRLRDEALWSRWHDGARHRCAEWLRQAAYGLPELSREQIRLARLVANPGCYPTAILLGLLPLLKVGGIDVGDIIADAKSGVSGAGRKPNLATGFCTVDQTCRAYGASGHRHLPELLQVLQPFCEVSPGITFVPHLLPMVRGIEASIYLRVVRETLSQSAIQSIFEDYYRDEPFVDVLPPGSHPDTGMVRGTNRCCLALHLSPEPGRLVVLSVIDNLIKGASGQAVQNMNVLHGLEETTGLYSPAINP